MPPGTCHYRSFTKCVGPFFMESLGFRLYAGGCVGL